MMVLFPFLLLCSSLVVGVPAIVVESNEIVIANTPNERFARARKLQQTTCETAADCQNGDHCHSGVCEGHDDDCISDADCSGDMHCHGGVCEGHDCTTDADCADGAHCHSGVCDHEQYWSVGLRSQLSRWLPYYSRFLL
eukprot:GHVN01102948.1.p1 GENE.GHVN01102948.1~~GHVN01102948.1.p1  ORF type:complete len:139 (+),score=17.17 GHVN01102948.1:2205-2621(+)